MAWVSLRMPVTLLAALNEPASLDLRANALKATRDEARAALLAEVPADQVGDHLRFVGEGPATVTQVSSVPTPAAAASHVRKSRGGHARCIAADASIRYRQGESGATFPAETIP